MRHPVGLTLSLSVAGAVALAALSFCTAAQGQGTSALQITSPADGTLVHPAETVTVTVTQPRSRSHNCDQGRHSSSYGARGG